MVAEKLEAMVQLGMANSRMKDFYDLLVLSEEFAFEGEVLARAIRATFQRRGTALPTGLPIALTPAFTNDAAKVAQWTAFERKVGAGNVPALSNVANSLAQFLSEPMTRAAADDGWLAIWPPRGPWSSTRDDG